MPAQGGSPFPIVDTGIAVNCGLLKEIVGMVYRRVAVLDEGTSMLLRSAFRLAADTPPIDDSLANPAAVSVSAGNLENRCNVSRQPKTLCTTSARCTPMVGTLGFCRRSPQPGEMARGCKQFDPELYASIRDEEDRHIRGEYQQHRSLQCPNLRQAPSGGLRQS